MDSYWEEGSDRLTQVGALVRAAKDQRGNSAAVGAIQDRLVQYVDGLQLPADPLVLAVPPGPHREAHPVPALAAAVAARLGSPAGDALTRRYETARLRGTPPEFRRRVVESAGYVVSGDVVGRAVLLVDDVILTGTTLGFLAELLVSSGAAEVSAVVVCRTRLATEPRTAGRAAR